MSDKAPEPTSRRIAAIDIGTNSAHLVVAELDDGGDMRLLETEKITLRLGSAVDAEGNLTADGIQRTVEAMGHLGEVGTSYGATIRAVATHATREAPNHQELIDKVRKATGIVVELIDGVEEARLTFLGMRFGFSLRDVTCLAVDIGGGSTEIILGRNDEIRYAGSFKLGAVVLTDKYRHPGPSGIDVNAVERHVQTRLAPLPYHLRKLPYAKAIASSGTAKALARIHIAMAGTGDPDDLNGHVIPFQDLRDIVTELRRLGDPKAIAKRADIELPRAEILIPGALILEECSRLFKVQEWTISTWGLREGLVADCYRRMSGRPPGMLPDVQWHTIKQFAKRLGVTKGEHHKQVAELTRQLFESLAPLIRPDDPPEIRERDEELLRGAAYLHECGKFLSGPQYHKHTYYLISNSRLPGFTTPERQMMALIARFHRKGIPGPQNPLCVDLTMDELNRLRFLAAILRLAAALDRSRKSRVTEVEVALVGKELVFDLRHDPARKPPAVELHKALLEKKALEKSFGRDVQFNLKPLTP